MFGSDIVRVKFHPFPARVVETHRKQNDLQFIVLARANRGGGIQGETAKRPSVLTEFDAVQSHLAIRINSVKHQGKASSGLLRRDREFFR